MNYLYMKSQNLITKPRDNLELLSLDLVWKDHLIFKEVEGSLKEFPPVAKRLHLMEKFHYDFCHVGAPKLCHLL